MPNSDEPVWRTELPDLSNDFADVLAIDAERDRERATALEHSLTRVRRQQEGGLSGFQSAIGGSSADFGSAVG